MRCEFLRACTLGDVEFEMFLLYSLRNWVKTAAARALLDASGFTRTVLHRTRLTHGLDLDRMGNDLDYIAQWVQSSVWPGWHVCGTCRIGRKEDPLAVVDDKCRVRQIKGLRVIDASVMPTIPSANTNLPTIAIAEKMASVILRND